MWNPEGGLPVSLFFWSRQLEKLASIANTLKCWEKLTHISIPQNRTLEFSSSAKTPVS
jgi:hypothetical protein